MQCDVCGNDYDKPLLIEYQGESFTFDCFECAITMLAPRCDVCGVRIIGHGTEADGTIYCCAHCAARAGHPEIQDRA